MLYVWNSSYFQSAEASLNHQKCKYFDTSDFNIQGKQKHGSHFFSLKGCLFPQIRTADNNLQRLGFLRSSCPFLSEGTIKIWFKFCILNEVLSINQQKR